MILHNPRYSGAYVYGRTRQKKLGSQVPGIGECPGSSGRPSFPTPTLPTSRGRSLKLIRRSCWRMPTAMVTDRRRSAPREGAALLQGVVVCGVCGLRMTVRYQCSIKDFTRFPITSVSDGVSRRHRLLARGFPEQVWMKPYRPSDVGSRHTGGLGGWRWRSSRS